MTTTLKTLTTVCAGALLLACAPLHTAPPAAPQASRSTPDRAAADAVYAEGRSEQLARRYAEAEWHYQAALRADARHVDARNGLATLYAEQGRYGAAIALWLDLTAQALPKAGPQQAYLFGNLGYAYLLDGQFAAALPALERACVLDPLDERAWTRLADALRRLGQGERADLMLRQARALQAHDVKADYALAGHGEVAAIEQALAADAPRAGGWPATELRALGAGMLELRRVPSAAMTAAPASAATLAAAQPVTAGASPAAPAAPIGLAPPARLEIINGNGVRGMARALGRSIGRDDMRVVRLSNQKGFAVRQTRIEYRSDFADAARRLALQFNSTAVPAAHDCHQADLCMVIGHDLRRRPPSSAARQVALAAGGAPL